METIEPGSDLILKVNIEDYKLIIYAIEKYFKCKENNLKWTRKRSGSERQNIITIKPPVIEIISIQKPKPTASLPWSTAKITH